MQSAGGAANQQPAPRVPSLKFQDAQSFLKTRTALSNMICNRYGVDYDFIETGIYRTFDIPAAMYPGNVVPNKTEVDAEKADRLSAWRK